MRVPESLRWFGRDTVGNNANVHAPAEPFALDDGDVWSDLLGTRRVGCAESCTGGKVAQLLACIPGSSEWFRGGLVAYQSSLKVELLGITPGPVVNERAATEMSIGAARLLAADATVAVTGAAGPDPLDGAAPGTVVIATFVDGTTSAATYNFPGSRAVVCERASVTALHHLGYHLECAARRGGSRR